MSDQLLEQQRFLKGEKVTSTPVALIAGSIGGATQVLVYVCICPFESDLTGLHAK